MTLVTHDLRPMVRHAGEFVEIGVYQDDFIDIIHLGNRYIKNPAEVDEKRGRISLSLRDV